MTAVWWGKEAGAGLVSKLKRKDPTSVPQPELMPSSRQVVKKEVQGLIKSFTPEWTNIRPGDPGVALTQLFGEQMEPVLERLNRLPEKILVEFLNIAGIQPLPALPSAALLEFEVSDNAPESVFISKGFQVGAQPADGSGDLVIFETERNLVAAPAKISEIQVQFENLFFEKIDLKGEGFLPFGQRPEPGRSLFIGLSGNIVPGPTISLGIRVAAAPGAPPPVPSGGVAPLPVGVAPQLEWSVLDGTKFEAAEVVVDETGGFARSGVLELQVPRQWRLGRPRGLSGKEPLRWLRLEITSGTFAEGPVLSSIRLNMVRAIAARTIFNEALQPLPQSRNRQMRLSRTPVIPDSLIVEVDEGGFTVDEPEVNQPNTDEAQIEQDGQLKSRAKRWKQVSTLESFDSDDEVYVLDPLSGIVTFGDGVNGAPIPQGFRNVRAVRYQVGGGRAGAVAAETINTLLSSVPFITKVNNPWPASGGLDRESSQQAMRRGPEEIRARSRAVTIADYALLARQAQGANIARAHAVAGLHPAFPGPPIPGVVGVFVVPQDRNEGPPTAGEDSLRRVAEHLSKNAAPAGIEVVVAAPRYHKIKIEAAITARTGVNIGSVVRLASKTIDDYLHPLKGGDSNTGWTFGGTLRYQALVRRLTRLDDVTAVPLLNIIADGLRHLVCEDFIPEANALLWPEVHRIMVQEGEED